ncbi:small RNA-binding protein 11, chloroplastic-like [Mangifera indica]|uniref:small RNA-binding protein 11, chloroplastic-like n=1 Tax=Mangifera indica TaxID=29780 RepID=UPI001CFA87E3|nr:small RNA-binding protein 11, chloroplastic-like [Mangifera indica]
MAALRKIVKSSTGIESRSLIPPALFISCRAIASKLFVGGLSFSTSDEGLSQTFSQYGQVIEAKVVMDRVSDRSKGFGFVTFASEEEAEKALTGLNGKTINGRVIFVDFAKPKPKDKFESGGMPIARGPPEQLSDRVKVDFFNQQDN